MAEMNLPLVTVVTVVLNDAGNLEKTIQSVLNQTYPNIEYIIIDGGSTDGTLNVIAKYDSKIDFWLSKSDAGIYDAMNKGIGVSNGAWINFMNSGDEFCDREAVKSFVNWANTDSAEIAYGDHFVRTKRRTLFKKAGDVESLWQGWQFCHQSAFISLELHKANLFNTSNKYCADFEFFYKMATLGVKFLKMDYPVATVLYGGVSTINKIDCYVSWWNVVRKTNRINCHYIWLILKAMIKDLVKERVGYVE